MRLIDADEFLKNEIERCGCVPVIGSCTSDNAIFKFVLEQQPTAYDVEAVVKELEHLKCFESTDYAINKAIEIVKGGVK